MFPDDVTQFFAEWKQQDKLSEVTNWLRKLIALRKTEIVFGDAAKITPGKRTLATCIALQQTCLHRAEHLSIGIPKAIFDGNVYGAALQARGHYEATALIGYFCNRLESLAKGNIQFEEFQLNAADAMMGAKHETFPQARPPLNVMTCIEKADKFVDQFLVKQKKGLIADSYNWLSEFCHPNFMSHTHAMKLDKATGIFKFQHGRQVKETDFHLVDYLLMSNSFFVEMYAAFDERLAAAEFVKKSEG